MEQFIGTAAAIVTPFDEQGAIDFNALGKLLKHTDSLDYWVICGTTAESATLSSEEKAEILEFAKTNNPTDKPIMFGLGSNNTLEVVRQLQETDLSGVDAILSVCPYYVKPTQQGIIAHYQAVADASPVPVLLYNVPGRTGVNMDAETVIELSNHPNIFGIKDASGDLVQGMRIANGTADDFLLISGEDTLTVPLISVGAKGVISVIANILPHEYRGVVNSALEGDFKAASKEMNRLVDFNESLFEEGNPTGVKTALEIAGICQHHVRLPLVNGSEELKSKMQEMIANIKLSARKEVFFSKFDAKAAI
ncbi:4-hydroxy-tetrahydrodipicolinate synthase [Limibacter armeniacum]|uniref:4-hydroxy-tetrahydrodipicolinate synthase n=1 Tax=Limibacter armeniacum TaxID=466084 RepID=UPI002FE5D407